MNSDNENASEYPSPNTMAAYLPRPLSRMLLKNGGDSSEPRMAQVSVELSTTDEIDVDISRNQQQKGVIVDVDACSSTRSITTEEPVVKRERRPSSEWRLNIADADTVYESATSDYQEVDENSVVASQHSKESPSTNISTASETVAETPEHVPAAPQYVNVEMLAKGDEGGGDSPASVFGREHASLWSPMTLACHKLTYWVPRQNKKWGLKKKDVLVDEPMELKSMDSPTGFNDQDKKFLLHGFSGCFRPGELVAILGPSGSGKTTFLDLITCRLTESRVGGKLRVNNVPLTREISRMCFGYVGQEDCLHETLTVRETLMYTYRLRFGTDKEARKSEASRIKDVLDELGLTNCADTRVGGISFRGISGGERKRLSIAIELLKRPSVLICDEVTTGLDSCTALSIVQTLQKLASRNRLVICTIHQPQTSIYRLFDKILLMARGGHVVYFGEGGEEAVSYFDSLGYICDKQTNPSDHFLDLIGPFQQQTTSAAEKQVTDVEEEMANELTMPKNDVPFLIQAYKESQLCQQNHEDAEYAMDPSLKKKTSAMTDWSECTVDRYRRTRRFSLDDSLLLGECVIVETLEEVPQSSRHSPTSRMTEKPAMRERAKSTGGHFLTDPVPEKTPSATPLSEPTSPFDTLRRATRGLSISFNTTNMQLQFRRPSYATLLNQDTTIKQPNWFTRFAILCRRILLQVRRSQLTTSFRLFQAGLIGVLIGLTFFQAGVRPDQTTALDLRGVLFFSVFSPAALSLMGVLPLYHGWDRLVFQREYGSGLYNSTVYFMSRFMTDLPFIILAPTFFALATYFLVGLAQSWSQFFVFLGCVILCSICGHSAGMVVSIYSSSLEVANVVAPLIFGVMLLSGGYLINVTSVPDWLSGLVYVNFVTYANEIVNVNQFAGMNFTCPPPLDLSNTTGPIPIPPSQIPRGASKFFWRVTHPFTNFERYLQRKARDRLKSVPGRGDDYEYGV